MSALESVDIGVCFSGSYSEARARLLDLAAALGAELHSYRIHAACDDPLFIDVAILGEANAPTLLLSVR